MHCNEQIEWKLNLRRQVRLLLSILFLSACAGAYAAVNVSTGQEEQRHRILITNDDGIQSPGIQQLARAIAEFADVVVLAPEVNESGASQSTRILRGTAQVNSVDIGDSIAAYSINATPSDCIALGVRIFDQDGPFDLVVSGVNAGGNVGSSYFYSGTIGAAFEGLVNEIPSIAVSQSRDRTEFQTSVEFTVKVVKLLLANPLPTGELLSINVPAGAIKGVRARPADGQAYNVGVAPAGDETAPGLYKAVIRPLDQPLAGSDIESYREGYIVITPLQLNRNSYDSLVELQELSVVGDWPGNDSSDR